MATSPGRSGLAAVTLRIPLVLTEADSHLGLTNRVLARGARRVCLAFPLAGREGPRYRVTGRPVPPAQEDRAGARERLGLAAGRDCVLVFGGSLGARSINLAAIEAFAQASPAGTVAPPATSPDSSSAPTGGAHGTPTGTLTGAPTGTSTDKPATSMAFDVLHVAGRRDYPELSACALPEGYDLREYLDLEQFGDALAAADLVVARAGGSVFEIAASGTPAILVPYPHASADHQTANARWMAARGRGDRDPRRRADAARLAVRWRSCWPTETAWRRMARASLGLARPDAAGDIAGELLKAAAR